MFMRIARTAGFAGLLAALLLTLLQSLWVTPLILHAETFENSAPHGHEAGVAEHHHDTDAWAPDDGWQRLVSTGGANLVMALGFALILAGLYTLRAPGRIRDGLLWGLGGFASFSLAPALGLPPELPGTAAADLALRQYWWIGTASATAVGLALIAFARPWSLRILGVLVLAVPHLFGAPQPEVHASLAPAALGEQFILASLVTHGLFWLVLGLASVWFFRRAGATQAA